LFYIHYYSNTTLVNVKCFLNKNIKGYKKNSNTTLVNVKFNQ